MTSYVSPFVTFRHLLALGLHVHRDREMLDLVRRLWGHMLDGDPGLSVRAGMLSVLSG